MQFPKTFAAARRAERSQWAIGEALLEEIGPSARGSRQSAAFETCARELREAGMPYTVPYLMELRTVAQKFSGRSEKLSIEQARVAGTPQMLAKAQKVAEAEGKPLTKRLIQKVAKTARSMERKERGLKDAPTPKPVRPASDRPVSEIRRMANVLDLAALADDAAKTGRKFLQAIAGFELSADEREELVEDIDRTLEVWKLARQAVTKPLSTEVEDYLRSNA